MNKRSNTTHYARKRFGQNFLQDQYIINQIVSVISPNSGDHLVEIGPGLGAITEPVAEMIEKLTVIELDRDLVERLTQHPKLADKLTIYQADALKFDFKQLITHPQQKLKIFGNLPYNISTPLLFHLFQFIDHLESMHFMLQKEVVERMVAKPGSKAYGRLTIMTQYYCQATPVIQVSPDCFDPPPKVDSAVIRLIPDPNRSVTNIQQLSQVCTTAFNQRRKTLRNCLKQLISVEQLQQLNIDPNLRPDNLSLNQYIAVANFIESNTKHD